VLESKVLFCALTTFRVDLDLKFFFILP
jgi:hypothetical protein